jgi:hypothetical protein
MSAVVNVIAERALDREKRQRDTIAALRARQPAFSYSVSELEGDALMEAEKHQPEKDGFGCDCGFVAWSVEHVMMKTLRVIIPLARRTGP